MDSNDAVFEYLQRDDYDSLTASIYGAAAGSNHWRDACERIARRFRLSTFQISALRKSDGAIVMLQEGGTMLPSARVDYLSRFHPHNPRVGLMLDLKGREWLHVHDVLGEARIESDPYFRDFMTGHGARWMHATRVVEDSQHDTFLGVVRDANQRPLDAGEIGALEILRNHIRNALRFEREMGELLNRSADNRAMLSVLPYAVALIDAQGVVEFGNRAWRRIALGDLPIHSQGADLRFVDDAAQACFAQALARLFPASDVAGGEPQSAFDRVVWRIGEHGARDEHLVIALALRAERSGKVFGASNKALLILHPLQSIPVLDAFLLGHAFDLTPAEAQVAVAMASGARPEEIARRRSVSSQTVRTQVRSLYAKLDVSREADLVRVLAALPNLDGGVRSSIW